MTTTAEAQTLLVKLLDPSNRSNPYPVYDQIRERIGRVVPGCEGYDEVIRDRGGFTIDDAHFYWYTAARAPGDLESAATVGRIAGERTARRLNARRIGTLFGLGQRFIYLSEQVRQRLSRFHLNPQSSHLRLAELRAQQIAC